MRGFIARGLFSLALFVCAAGPAAADMVINGSFEEPPIAGMYQFVSAGSNSISGWETVGTGVERFDPVLLLAGSAHDGSLILDLNSDSGPGGGVQQTFATTPGKQYVLSFFAGTWLDHGRNGTGNVEVSINDSGYPFTVVNLNRTIIWTPLALTFTATTGSTTIAFRNFDGPAETFSVIDSVSLEEVVPPPVIDEDHDGVLDDADQCPDSDASATIVIDGCDTGVPNTGSATGCKISDAIAECATSARNHGQFVSCVTYVTNNLKKAGTITGAQKGAIVSCAAQANIP